MQKIANHFTQLYTPASYDCPTPIDLTRLENLHSDHLDFEGLAEAYRQRVEIELHKLRPHTFIATDGTVYSHDEWKPLTQTEATQLYWNVTRINIGSLLALFTR